MKFALPDETARLAVHAALHSDGPISSQLLQAAQEMGKSTRAEPGCLSYHLGLDVESASILRLTETWKDRPALAAHFTTPHMAAFREALRAEGKIRTEIDILAISGREELAM